MKALIISCCQAKLEHAAPAIELYQNRVWNLVRRYRAELESAEIAIFAFSAEHGIVPADTVLEPYDRKMTELRSKQMALRVIRESHLFDHYGTFVAFGGFNYRYPIRELADVLGGNFVELVGRDRGCGDHYAALVEFIETNSENLGYGS